MRLIDADKVNIVEFAELVHIPPNDYLRLCAFFKKQLIDEQPTINPENCRPQWISVDERMPELIPCNAGSAYSEAVIVWTDNRKAMIAVWDGIDFLCAFDYWEAWGEKITHWMPLPKPPKGE